MNKEQIIKKYLLLFKIIDLDPLMMSSKLILVLQQGALSGSFLINSDHTIFRCLHMHVVQGPELYA